MGSLNQEQIVAVESTAKQLLLCASAGSGKSRTLVARIQRMVADGVDPSRIIVISFTNSAADVFKSRLAPIVPGVCSTLHSFLLRMLVRHGQAAGMIVSGVLDDEEKEQTLAAAIAAVRCREPMKVILPLLRRPEIIWKKSGMTPSKAEQAAMEYHNILRREGLLDYDSILLYGERFVRYYLVPNSHNLSWWRYEHLLVDEAQDSAPEDWSIYERLPVRTRFVVGDDSQSVYQFRGADVSQFLTRAQPDSGWKLLNLETNYRSGAAICEAANRGIAVNVARIDKKLVAVRPGGVVRVRAFDSPAQQHCYLVDEIARLLPEKTERRSIGVLSRTNRLASDVTSHLLAQGLPVERPSRPTLPRDWRRTKALLAALASPWNDRAVLRFLELSQGKEFATATQRAASKALTSVNAQLGKMFHVEQSSLLVTLREKFQVSVESMAIIEEINDPSLDVADIYAKAESYGNDVESTGDGLIYVGTVHSAKGLEFDAVFLTDCEEGIFPDGRPDTSIPEERRLFHVGITRAKDMLVATWCRSRPVWRGKNLPVGPAEARTISRFIAEAGIQG